MQQLRPTQARLVSVDVLRGLTIALMILVNDPGDWAHTYRQLDHAAWNGFTLTDFVFPNFLFLVGVSIILSMRARLARAPGGKLDPGVRRVLVLRIVRRAALLVAIKLLLSAYPHFHLGHLRLFGVLTRIALCYLAAALLCVYTQRARTLAVVAAVLLVGYWVLLRWAPVPGIGLPGRDFPFLDPDRNLAAWLDRGFNGFTQRWLHTGSLYNRTRDPEGLLSTVPAIATTIIGCLAGLWLTRAPQTARKPRAGSGRFGLILGGVGALAGGLLWAHWFPLNKNLWTSSYVLFAGGWSLLLLGVAHWLYDVRRAHETRAGRIASLPWLIFGSNAITAYVLSNWVVETLLAIRLANPADPAHPLTAWSCPYWRVFARHGSTDLSSLAFAVTFTALCVLPVWVLWRRRIFLRL